MNTEGATDDWLGKGLVVGHGRDSDGKRSGVALEKKKEKLPVMAGDDDSSHPRTRASFRSFWIRSMMFFALFITGHHWPSPANYQGSKSRHKASDFLRKARVEDGMDRESATDDWLGKGIVAGHGRDSDAKRSGVALEKKKEKLPVMVSDGR